MKVKLGFLDRYAILSVLPKQEHFLTLVVADEIEKLVRPSVAEHEAVGFRINPQTNAPEWQTDKDEPREFTFGEAMRDLVVRELKKLDSEGKLTRDHIGIYRDFVGEPQADGKKVLGKVGSGG